MKEPIEKATILWEDTSIETSSNKNGGFSIQKTSYPSQLVIQKKNFKTLVVPHSKIRDN